MRLRKLRWFWGGLLLLASFAVLIWGSWPGQLNKFVMELPGSNFELSQAAPSILPGEYQLQIIWPDRVHTGSLNHIQLRMDPILKPDSKLPQDPTSGRPPTIELRLEMPGIRFVPEGEISQALTPGKSLQYSWQILTPQAGVYSGTIWLHLNSTLADVVSTGKRILLLSQPIQIQSTRLLGLDAYLAQVVGIIGIVLGAAMCIDLIIEATSKFWWKSHEDHS